MILDLVQQSLGSREMDQFSRQLGTGPQQTEQAVAAALPLLLGALGKAQRRQGVEARDLSATLRQEAKSSAAASPFGGLLALLDSDQDGDTTDDIARIGSQLLGGLFKNK